MSKAFLTDTTKCIGCRGCQVACKEWNGLPAGPLAYSGSYENPKFLSATSWRKVRFVEPADGAVRWSFLSDSCKHCSEANCLASCPTGAIYRSPTGAVVVNDDRCNGCRYCVAACPYKVIGFDDSRGRVAKCTLCSDRTEAGLNPACVTSCPSGALLYGDREAMLKAAKDRVAQLTGKMGRKAFLYGEKEMGGLNSLMVLGEPPSSYGLPDNPAYGAKAVLPSSLMSIFGAAVTMAAAVVAFRERKSSEGEGR